MLISNVKIENYRNLRSIDVNLNNIVVLIGDNNSGKTNFLRAITLPFVNHEIGALNKSLGFQDINNQAKDNYFSFIKENREEIISNDALTDDFVERFEKIIPKVSVEVSFQPQRDLDFYYIRKWLQDLNDERKHYAIRYEFEVEDKMELLKQVSTILEGDEYIKNLEMNLLPIELYKYSIINPLTNEKISYTDLSLFKYNALQAERDDFSSRTSQLGSKALVTILQSKLNIEDKKKIELSYNDFFTKLKEISEVDSLFNWQEFSDIENAKEFFENIDLMPNIPPLHSLLNNVYLGYGDEYLSLQGLGYRNLVYLFVMLNALDIEEDTALNILTIEEPEAHLSVSNNRLLASFINSIIDKSQQIQIFISTHSTDFLNKLELENVVVVTEGNAFSLKDELDAEQLNYLGRKYNMDFLRFLYSRNCILVEGPTEEMLIKSYLNKDTSSLDDIEVISLHKGFRKMMDIWLKVNMGTNKRLGIVRDFDNQPQAQQDHEEYSKKHDNILVKTTENYTLEPEIIDTGDNFSILKKYFSEEQSWGNIDTEEKLVKKWKSSKAETMFKFAKDLGLGKLEGIELPAHIQGVIDFLKTGEKE